MAAKKKAKKKTTKPTSEPKGREAKTTMIGARLRPSVKAMLDEASRDLRFDSQSRALEVAIREFYDRHKPFSDDA